MGRFLLFSSTTGWPSKASAATLRLTPETVASSSFRFIRSVETGVTIFFFPFRDLVTSQTSMSMHMAALLYVFFGGRSPTRAVDAADCARRLVAALALAEKRGVPWQRQGNRLFICQNLSVPRSSGVSIDPSQETTTTVSGTSRKYDGRVRTLRSEARTLMLPEPLPGPVTAKRWPLTLVTSEVNA